MYSHLQFTSNHKKEDAMAVLEDLTISVRTVVERVRPSVVGLGRGWGRGSGVIVAPGRIVTNAHNLRGDDVTITFDDGRAQRGQVLGVDPDGDLAVLGADTQDLDPLPFGDSASLDTGSVVFALANPGGRGLRATLGLVSATDRSFRAPRGRRFRGAIEHSAPLPRGSAGGPLVDAEGRLMGINTVRIEGGLILAIAADDGFADRVEALARGEAVARPRLGVAVAPARVARRLRRAVGLPDRDGLLIHGVEADSPADVSGLEKGDLLVRAGGRDLRRVDDLHSVLEGAVADGELEVVAVRGVEEREVVVSLAAGEAR
jgi:serine protease Do